MLGYTREQIKQIVNDNFIGEYTVDEERSDAIVLRKMYVHKPIILISLIFDHKNVLYKINVKIKKVTGTPPPDEVVKVIEDKYGAPQKRTISNTLDIMAYWYLDNNRYEIFFHNIASWDKFDVQYTDTVAQKQKEDYDREMNRKPVNRELDF